MTAILAICGTALAALAVVGWVVGVAESAPDISQLKPLDPGGSSEVFAADGTSLGFIQSTVLRTYVHNNQIPRALKEATVAIEDRRFYKHKGVDYQGILRAAIKDVFGSGKSIQGGSTLTMQLVRNLYLPKSLADTRTLKRKIIEAKLAEELEQHHTKAWILTNYLNDVDYGTVGGQSAYGVGAAAQMFFDKPVWELNLAQSALLAGLPQAPSLYNPFTDVSVARARRHDVLHAMVQAHYISQSEADAADSEPLGVKHNTFYQNRREPYFFDYVHEALIQKFCPKSPNNCPKVDRGGLKIYTTLDLKRQQEARDAIVKNEGNPGDPAASLVTIDPSNGHIVAMASSVNYDRDNFNYAAQAHRQTGSAFKVFLLMTAIHDYGADPNQTYYTSRELFPGWLPGYPTYHVQTAEHSYLGTVSLTKATILSDNTVFAQLDADLGPEKIRAMAYAMGITSHLDALPAEGIGGLRTGVSALEMADAYATVANGGYHIPATAITKVVFSDGSAVSLGDPPRTQVFTDGEAAAAIDVLKGVITSGTGTAADIGCPAAGKTGTTSNYTDAWFVGFTPKLSTAVWVGYPKRTTSMYDVNGLGPGFGGTLAAPIWHDYMTHATAGYCGDFTPPTTTFSGTPFFGKYASTGGSSTSPGYGSGSGSGSGTGSGTGTTTNPYTNPRLYQGQPQAPGQAGGGGSTGTGSGPPSGFGTGHTQGTGGAGIGH
jgi:penicillin-binding protein 1A